MISEYNHNKIKEYNDFFLTSHAMLANWIQVTLLFLILVYNDNVKMHFWVITPVCIVFSITSIFMSYRSFRLTKLKEVEIYKMKNIDLSKELIYYPSIISFILFICTVIISIAILYRLIIQSNFSK